MATEFEKIGEALRMLEGILPDSFLQAKEMEFINAFARVDKDRRTAETKEKHGATAAAKIEGCSRSTAYRRELRFKEVSQNAFENGTLVGAQ